MSNPNQRKQLRQQIRERLMNSPLRDSQTRETIPQLVFNEGMDLIVEEVANFILGDCCEHLTDRQYAEFSAHIPECNERMRQDNVSAAEVRI